MTCDSLLKMIFWIVLFMVWWYSCGGGEGKKPAYGIDISQWQGDMEQALRSVDSLDFVICKATEGATGKDTDFSENWKDLDTLNMIRGAYHFYDCSESAHAQVLNFLSVVDQLLPRDLPPVVDVEGAYSMNSCTPSQGVQDSLLYFLDELKNRTGRTPIIYTNPSTANTYLNNDAFGVYPLYIADWDVDSPGIPEAWENSEWVFWQKSNQYPLQPGDDDLDVFNGDLRKLKKFIRTH